MDVAMLGGRAHQAFLFDLDGTLLTSIEAAERVWSRWAASVGLPSIDFLEAAHGMRVTEVIAALGLADVDPVIEAARIFEWELIDTCGIREVPGASSFLASLPSDRWAVVTSAPRALALHRMAVAKLPPPPLLISAEDIARGKPDPSCFQLAAERLAVDIARCVIFEDATVGIAAAKAAGASVLRVTAVRSSDGHPDVEEVSEYVGLHAIRNADSGFRLFKGSCQAG